jgi:proteic killer suppression protein
MILSFGDKQTEELWLTERSKRYGNIARIALRKLLQLHAAERLADLAVPPGNRLEAQLDAEYRAAIEVRRQRSAISG